MKLREYPLRSSLRIRVEDVRLGMFIAELDRPWTDTPFLMQGFLLGDPIHLASLRDFVLEVTIDPSRSTHNALMHLPWDALHLPLTPQTELLPAPVIARATYSSPARGVVAPSLMGAWWRDLRRPHGRKVRRREVPSQVAQPKEYYLRYAAEATSAPTKKAAGALLKPATQRAVLASELTPPSTPEFSKFIASLYPSGIGFSFPFFDRIALWLEKRRRQAKRTLPFNQAPARKRDVSRLDFLPKNIPLVVYRDQATIAQESVRASQIVLRADVMLEKMVSDIQANLPVTIEAVQPIVAVLVDSVISNPAALMWSTRMRDECRKTYMHSLKVAIYLMTLGRHLGFPREQLSELGTIGLLLDIGMLKMPTSLVEKAAALTQEENALLVKHVDYSLQALEQDDPLPRFVARGIYEHHERIDGSGYPQGLAGDEISVYGRMAAIADTFAAMTTARPYDVTHSPFDAMKELFREAESKLHAPLVEQFVQAISIFPVGSLIELSSGEVAIVLEHNGVRRLEPTVLVLTDPDKNLLAQPVTLELMGANRDRKKILRGLADGAYGIDYRDYYLN